MIVDLRRSDAVVQTELERNEYTEHLFAQIYGELRALAHVWFRSASTGKTLQPTAVVHEAYLRLAAHNALEWRDCAHFKALAARVMLQVFSDYCRKQRAAKRGAGKKMLTLTEAEMPASPPIDVAIFDLQDALTKLALLSERQSTIVVLRFLGGMTVQETAAAVGVSERTVKLDWKMARAWLLREIQSTE